MLKLSREECFVTLGLNDGATEGEIKSAYKKMALKTHPDKNKDDPDANNKFLRISEAYKRLIDPDSFKDEDDEADFAEHEAEYMEAMMQEFASFMGEMMGGGRGSGSG